MEKDTPAGCELPDVIHGNFIVDLANAIINNKKESFIINFPNTGIISNFPQNTVVECVAQIDAAGYHPLNVGEIPIFEKGLMEIMKTLLSHPLKGWFSLIKYVLSSCFCGYNSK